MHIHAYIYAYIYIDIDIYTCIYRYRYKYNEGIDIPTIRVIGVVRKCRPASTEPSHRHLHSNPHKHSIIKEQLHRSIICQIHRNVRCPSGTHLLLLGHNRSARLTEEDQRRAIPRYKIGNNIGGGM